jgi:hypothetical protein
VSIKVCTTGYMCAVRASVCACFTGWVCQCACLMNVLDIGVCKYEQCTPSKLACLPFSSSTSLCRRCISMLPLSLDALISKEVVVEAEVEVVEGVREERGIRDMWSEEEARGEMGEKR